MAVPLNTLPRDLQDRFSGVNLIIFDGECVLCSGFYQFVSRVDRNRAFQFATAQSPVGQAFYAALTLDATDFETNLVLARNHVHMHLDSVAATMRLLGWPWRALAGVAWLPRSIKAPLYHSIARNRFRILGRKDTCMIPGPQARERFVPGGW